MKEGCDRLPMEDGHSRAAEEPPNPAEFAAEIQCVPGSPSVPVRNRLLHCLEEAPYLNEYERGCLLAGLSDLQVSDPAADAAYTFYLTRYAAPQDDRNPMAMASRVLSHWLAAQLYLHRAQRLAGARPAQIARWLPFVAAARLREDPSNTEVQAILRIIGRYCRAKRSE